MRIFKNAEVYIDGRLIKKDIVLEGGRVSFSVCENQAFADVFDFSGCIIIPGLTDVHVHLREPGFSYKETIKTGTAAAASAGYTKVFSMPNLNPVPDNEEHLAVQTDIIKRDAEINVFPYGAITVDEKGEKLADLAGLCDKVIAFSDDGKGVQRGELMEEAMRFSANKGKIIAAHCEDNSLLFGGYIHDGEYAKKNNHKGICSKSEYKQVERDIKIAGKTGCAYHVCHISAAESVELIRKAKKSGINISCETAPHYLILSDNDLKNEGRFKMNPPIRSERDRLALIEGLKDGTIDMIATDHAPHSAEEKSKGLRGSLMGVVGLETAFPVMYTNFVKTGIITIEKLIELMSINPCRRFGLEAGIKNGMQADLCVIDLKKRYTLSSEEFLSMGRSTPFDKTEVFSKNILTVCCGKTVYSNTEERKIANAL